MVHRFLTRLNLLMKNISLVILFNKKIEDSTTLQTLLSSHYNGALVIFNNGPREISSSSPLFFQLEHQCSEVTLIQDIRNKPLSMIYNEFLLLNGYNNYFIFDDDTHIPDSFFENKCNDNFDLSVPLIVSNKTGKIFYPIINGVVSQVSASNIVNSDEVISIGSGLLIKDTLIRIFNEHKMQLFDDRFALYGVDYSLFRRVSRLKRSNILIKIDVSGELQHSLSSEDNDISKFRVQERLIDLILTKLFYSERRGFFKYLSIGKTFLQNILANKISNGMLILLVLFYREHPRVRKFRKYTSDN